MDIIVTTPRSQMANARKEAGACKKEGGGFYFRYLGYGRPSYVGCGDRIFYVEDGAIRGFALIAGLRDAKHLRCTITKRQWPEGWYAFMNAKTWKWIVPIPMRGFQGWQHMTDEISKQVKVTGGWLDPKPEEKNGKTSFSI